jgi:excisionase family DNA binding protein
LAAKLPRPQTEARRFAGDAFDVKKWLYDHNIAIREEKRWNNNATIYVLETCPFDAAHGKDSRITHFDSGALSFGCFHKVYLGIGKDKAYELAQRKDFPKVRFGNKYVFRKKLVDEWMERQAIRGTLPRKLRAI